MRARSATVNNVPRTPRSRRSRIRPRSWSYSPSLSWRRGEICALHGIDFIRRNRCLAGRHALHQRFRPSKAGLLCYEHLCFGKGDTTAIPSERALANVYTLPEMAQTSSNVNDVWRYAFTRPSAASSLGPCARTRSCARRSVPLRRCARPPTWGSPRSAVGWLASAESNFRTCTHGPARAARRAVWDVPAPPDRRARIERGPRDPVRAQFSQPAFCGFPEMFERGRRRDLTRHGYLLSVAAQRSASSGPE